MIQPDKQQPDKQFYKFGFEQLKEIFINSKKFPAYDDYEVLEVTTVLLVYVLCY